MTRHSAYMLALVSIVGAGCQSEVRRFPLRDPVWIDGDLNPVSVACTEDPKEPGEQICRPEEYFSPFGWDVADKTLFRPMSTAAGLDVAFESINVNSFDEVPDSSWFTNRIGKTPMTPEEVGLGNCGKKLIDADASVDGSWLVDMGKPNGANPGFRVNIEGVGKFMLKADAEGEGEKATGATAIASRFYHAMGYFAPCDTVVYVRPSLLRLKPGLSVINNSGVARPFDQAALDAVLAKAAKRGEAVRFVASKWLPGRAVGPFRYEGTRADDPNDVVPHEERRDLRGARVIAAWLSHYDSREQNTMTTWMAASEKEKDSSPGHLLHWYIDLGDCFGSKWAWDPMTRRLGSSYYFDGEDVAGDLLSLGTLSRPWDRAKLTPGAEMFNYFSAEDFDPDTWKGGYPNPAFQRMSERDAAWATRILTRFEDAHLLAAMRAGDYTDPKHNEFLFDALRKRLHRIRGRYFAKLSPLADVAVEDRSLCAVDLARKAAVYPSSVFSYSAVAYTGLELEDAVSIRPAVADGGAVCVAIPARSIDSALPADHPARYAVVDLANGVAPGPLRTHLYQLPDGSLKLVGIERPDTDAWPN